jgi:putative ABC transport system permease protein
VNILESLRTAFTGLATNKLRAALTMLGIIIGVASVVALLSVGQGVQTTVAGSIQAIGSNLVFISAEQPEGSTRPAYITTADAEALSDPFNAPAIIAVAPVMQGSLRITHGEEAKSATVTGTNADYAQVRNLTLVLGGFLTQADLEGQARVTVLGSGLYGDLFAEDDYPIGQTVSIDGVPFEVVGVLKEQGGFGQEDSTAFVPLTTAQARFFTRRTLSGQRPLAVIYASVVDQTQVDAATEQITSLLRERHGLEAGDPDDFSITTQQMILDIAGQITGVLTIFLGAIAGISLLVGGIGIMNIMLVSVTERTREVGIRKAVGATRRDILVQFLLEAIVLSFTGGVVGLLLGSTAASFISSLSEDLVTQITPQVVLLAVGVASAVGLIFGTYPALRAANLHPIDALRYE